MNRPSQKTVPQNVDAEEAVLGALMIDPEGIFRVLSFLRGEDFYLKKHQWIFEAVLTIHERRDPIDFLTINTCRALRDQYRGLRAPGRRGGSPAPAVGFRQ